MCSPLIRPKSFAGPFGFTMGTEGCLPLITEIKHGFLDVSKNRGKTPKMDGENNGKPYEQMDDLGVALFLETPIQGGFLQGG